MEYISRHNLIMLSSASINIIYIIIVLVILSAFFSMSETVFSSVKITRLESLKKDKPKKAKLAIKIANRYDFTLTSLLVGNNIVNIAIATMAVSVFVDILSQDYVRFADVFSTVSVTVIILIFGEILPKTYAKANADKVALAIAPLVNIVTKILFPITIIFLGLKNSLIRKSEEEEVTVTESEFDSIIGRMTNEGVIEDDEKEMLQQVLNLNDIYVSDIMTPRVEIHAINVNESFDEVLNKFFDLQYSRMPLYQETTDNIIGIIYEKEFLASVIRKEETSLRDLAHKPLFVPSSMKVDTLIETIQENKQHLAIVIDEYGGTSGLVTMEDALEVLVGEIYDEHDSNESKHIVEIKPDKYNIDASMDLEEFFEELNLGQVPDTVSTSLAGFLIELNEHIPVQGDNILFLIEKDRLINLDQEADEENIEYTKLNFKVKKIKDRRIIYVQLDIDTISHEDVIENPTLLRKLEEYKKMKFKI